MPAAVTRILIVEDDPHELGLALLALNASGMTVEVARDGSEALDRLLSPAAASLPPLALVLLDLKLPRIDGLEVARRLKAAPATRTIPIVVFSSSDAARDVLAGYHAGINSYIVKPVDFDQLRAMLDSIAHYWSRINLTHGAVS
jgi:DNA-binding response OmpR family regulator